MNEQTTKLIQELANKLGTTTEHLWGVLVRQAPIAATWGILELIINGLVATLLLIACKKLFVKAAKLDDSNDNEFFVLGTFISAWIVGIVGLLFTLGFLFGDIMGMSTTISGFLNPEYWALKQVIK